MRGYKNYTFFIVLNVILFFVGCSGVYDSENVVLASYDNIVINEEYIEITNEQIDTIIQFDLSYNQYFKETDKVIVEMNDIVLFSIACDDASYNIDYGYIVVGNEELNEDIDNFLLGKKIGNVYNLNTEIETTPLRIMLTLHGIYTYFSIEDEEEICNFYRLDTIAEVRDFFKDRAQKEIIFDYVWKIMLDNSKITNYPNEIISKIQNHEETKSQINGSSVVFDGLDNIYSYYNEILIAEAILKKEGQVIEDHLLNDKVQEISHKYGFTDEEVQACFSKQDIYYITLMDEVKKILVSKAIIQ